MYGVCDLLATSPFFEFFVSFSAVDVQCPSSCLLQFISVW